MYMLKPYNTTGFDMVNPYCDDTNKVISVITKENLS